ncbi:VOC family protein [Modestobacter sp. VKM Ac-2979]|uniref:VOC family protein n=1 Tax=unclassified Modestobacter TaxID=2643866 RepID=UPI0022AB6BC8|nr:MULTISPECIES: VOC family protein [unclassified Modestobacter]MCZ2814331.1 VOC family protein [Modestobacter sp. VKM Ac-2979]MCZ2843977.1 VOC family protein [Modestobacter sp. VKM Ac-2980]
MALTSVYPVLMSADLDRSARFFREHLAFGPTFESDWYVSLRRDQWELAVLAADHPTVPATHRGRPAAGVLLNVEVDDVDAEHQRMVVEGGLTAVLPLRSEPFGQRHFIVAGPDGVLVDVITPIPPEGEFVEQFR